MAGFESIEVCENPIPSEAALLIMKVSGLRPEKNDIWATVKLL
jgi:hypothetical protein